jgi:hypothetical protein
VVKISNMASALVFPCFSVVVKCTTSPPDSYAGMKRAPYAEPSIAIIQAGTINASTRTPLITSSLMRLSDYWESSHKSYCFGGCGSMSALHVLIR